jgi:hypothetical protein
MKMTIKVNIGNYESVDFTTNEYEDEWLDMYEEVMVFLQDWKDLGGARQLENINKIRARMIEEGFE